MPLEVVHEAEASPGIDTAGLEAALEEIGAETSTELGLSLSDAHATTSYGTLTTLPAWSTIKVPIALTAQQRCDMDEDYLQQLITWSIEISDNDSTDQLFWCLDAAGGAQKLVGIEAGVDIDVAWGRTSWPLAKQSEYAYELSQRDDLQTNPVFDHMRHIDKEQSWGLGALGLPFKGGWGDVEADGSWQSRQMAFGRINGVTYGIAVGAVSENGSFQDTMDALDAVAKLLVQ